MSYTQRDRNMPADEQKLFTNVLREFLGLGPLYGGAEESRPQYAKRRKRAAGASAHAPTNPQAEGEYPDAALDAAE